jgi:hypothetical protein
MTVTENGEAINETSNYSCLKSKILRLQKLIELRTMVIQLQLFGYVVFQAPVSRQ